LKVGEVLQSRLMELLSIELNPLTGMLLDAVCQWSHVQPDTVLVLHQWHAFHFQCHPCVVLEPFVELETREWTLRVPLVDNASLPTQNTASFCHHIISIFTLSCRAAKHCDQHVCLPSTVFYCITT